MRVRHVITQMYRMHVGHSHVWAFDLSQHSLSASCSRLLSSAIPSSDEVCGNVHQSHADLASIISPFGGFRRGVVAGPADSFNIGGDDVYIADCDVE